jgi:asparagine synthase (glutamine-hydrolysing)
MCGILGTAVRDGLDDTLTDQQLLDMRAHLLRRGPDGVGTWRSRGVALAHTRLAVRDLSAAGEQPMSSADGRWTLVYNGELYEDQELRRELSALGRRFEGHCDTETVLAAFEAWGTAAIPRLRGMFALAVYDARERRLILARDPLGMKPLYWWCDGRELAFASSPKALLAHPRISAEPNLHMVSAYLTTIRTSLGGQTLFKGVNTLEPGDVLEVGLNGGVLLPRTTRPWRATPVDAPLDHSVSPRDAAAGLREALTDSTTRHLQADVPTCVLLSGGLDSSVLAALASGGGGRLSTWCSGARGIGDSDFSHARRVAEHLGSDHHEVAVDAADFSARWDYMVDELGVPLSTPNEVAIFAVTEALRAEGMVVALSGEGADELFAGYEQSMLGADGFERSAPEFLSAGRFQLESAAWISPAVKPKVLQPKIAAVIEDDAFVIEEYDRLFATCASDVGVHASPLDPHLRFLRRNNLSCLLGRLDTASMLAGVEGRTPFADVRVMEMADALPMSTKFDLVAARTDAQIQSQARRGARGKLVLRKAFGESLPPSIISRPKASFPLPLQDWIGDHGGVLTSSAFAAELFQPELLQGVAADPAGNWSLAWPMANLARWGDRWWG